MWFLEGISIHKVLYKPGPYAHLSYNMIHIERRGAPAGLEKSLSSPSMSNVLLLPEAEKMLLFPFCHPCISKGGRLVKNHMVWSFICGHLLQR